MSGDGEVKTITFLDIEQELVCSEIMLCKVSVSNFSRLLVLVAIIQMLPEIGYQLLHNYAEPIKEWGWRCNIHAQDSGSFKRLFFLSFLVYLLKNLILV